VCEYLEWKAPKWTSKLEFLGPVTSFERKIDVEKSKSGRVRSWPCEFGTFGCVLVIKARLTQLQVLRYHPGILSSDNLFANVVSTSALSQPQYIHNKK